MKPAKTPVVNMGTLAKKVIVLDELLEAHGHGECEIFWEPKGCYFNIGDDPLSKTFSTVEDAQKFVEEQIVRFKKNKPITLDTEVAGYQPIISEKGIQFGCRLVSFEQYDTLDKAVKKFRAK